MAWIWNAPCVLNSCFLSQSQEVKEEALGAGAQLYWGKVFLNVISSLFPGVFPSLSPLPVFLFNHCDVLPECMEPNDHGLNPLKSWIRINHSFYLLVLSHTLLTATSESIICKRIGQIQSLLYLCLPIVKTDNKQSQQCKNSVLCGPGKARHTNLIWKVAAEFRRELVLLQWVEILASSSFQIIHRLFLPMIMYRQVLKSNNFKLVTLHYNSHCTLVYAQNSGRTTKGKNWLRNDKCLTLF